MQCVPAAQWLLVTQAAACHTASGATHDDTAEPALSQSWMVNGIVLPRDLGTAWAGLLSASAPKVTEAAPAATTGAASPFATAARATAARQRQLVSRTLALMGKQGAASVAPAQLVQGMLQDEGGDMITPDG